MRKYPYLLTIVHSVWGINSPIKLVIASTVCDNSKSLLHSFTCAAIEYKGIFVEVMDEDKLVNVFIPSHLLLNGIVQVTAADLSTDELETFNKCANTFL